MEFRPPTSGVSSSSTTANTTITTTATNDDPPPSWWESISKARSRIHLLSTLLLGSESESIYPNPFASLADSDRPARSLLSSSTAYAAVSSYLTASPTSGAGAGDDPICHWLYDTFLSSDSDLQLVVLSFVPLIAGIYLSRVHRLFSPESTSPPPPPPSVAGFEAVLLALYSSEAKARGGRPVLVTVPDLSMPSLYDSHPRVRVRVRVRVRNKTQSPNSSQETIGVVSPPIEPETVIKSTRRATIVGVVLESYHKEISQMPDWSKVDFCRFAADWAGGQGCVCRFKFDLKHETGDISDDNSRNEVEIKRNVLEQMKNWKISDSGTRIPLPWELLQPILRILGHCLMAASSSKDVKGAASVAVRCLYSRSCHDLVPEAIVATRSLIQLEERARVAAAAIAANRRNSNAKKSCKKAKKPEIHLTHR